MDDLNTFDYSLFSEVLNHCGFDLRSIGLATKRTNIMVCTKVREYAAQLIRKMEKYDESIFNHYFPKLDHKIQDLTGILSLKGKKTHNISIHEYALMDTDVSTPQEEIIYHTFLVLFTTAHFQPIILKKLVRKIVNELPENDGWCGSRSFTEYGMRTFIDKKVCQLGEMEPDRFWGKVCLFMKKWRSCHRWESNVIQSLIAMSDPHFVYSELGRRNYIQLANLESVVVNEEFAPPHVRLFIALKNKDEKGICLFARMCSGQFYKDLPDHHRKMIPFESLITLIRIDEDCRCDNLIRVLNEAQDNDFIDLFFSFYKELIRSTAFCCMFNKLKTINKSSPIDKSTSFKMFVENLVETKTKNPRNLKAYKLPRIIELVDDPEIIASLQSLLTLIKRTSLIKRT